MNGNKNNASSPSPRRTVAQNRSVDQARTSQQVKRPVNRQSSSPQSQRAQASTQRQPTKPTQRRTPQAKPQQPTGLKDNLRSQTPLNRKLRQQTASSEPGTQRRQTAPQYFKVKQTKGANKQKKKAGRQSTRSFAFRCTVLGLIAYAIILPLFLLTFSVLLPGFTSVESKEYIYQLGTNKNVVSKKVYPASTLTRSGVVYIDMDSIASYCKLTTTGNSERVKFVSRSSGESVEFVIGQSIAYINGVTERAGGDCYVVDGKVYIPLEFAKRCFIGITITLDTKNSKITIVRNTDDTGTPVDLSFPYKLPNTSDSINFGELDAEIQQDIIMQNQPSNPSQPDNNQNN